VEARREIAAITPNVRRELLTTMDRDERVQSISAPVLLLGHGPRVLDSVVQGTGIVTIAATAAQQGTAYWIASTAMCVLYFGLSWFKDKIESKSVTGNG
jgi:hypothetical protein